MGFHSFPTDAHWEPYLCTLCQKFVEKDGTDFLGEGNDIYIFFSPAADYLYEKNCLTVLTEFTVHLD